MEKTTTIKVFTTTSEPVSVSATRGIGYTIEQHGLRVWKNERGKDTTYFFPWGSVVSFQVVVEPN